MSCSIIVLALLALSLSSCQADVDVSAYIYWKKADISAWHQYFPSRGLEEERLTIQAAVTAVNNISAGLNASLGSIVAFQARELQTAELLMAGTDAEGCVQGISNYMDKAIDSEIATYEDCAADALSKLGRLNNTWAKLKTTYLAAYQRALSGIDACATTYPNKNSIDRLRSCVESMNSNYFSVANITQSSLFPSPSMSYIQQTVVECASDAARNVASKGSQFLKMLVDCAALSGTVDPTTYAEELSKWQGYNDTLDSQISASQDSNYYQVWGVEIEMQTYYNLQKQVLEQYVIESRGVDYYLNKMYLYLSDYYNTVVATSLDNPGDPGCVDTAKAELDAAVNIAAYKSLSCDLEIVNNTKELIVEVTNNFLLLNTRMPAIGNAAILECFSRGYVFAPNTIIDCFHLIYSGFEVDHSDRKDVILTDVDILSGYVNSFYSGADLPCGGSSLKRLLLAADIALYELQRCLYISSGTTYSVTTPSPFTELTPNTTTAALYTTPWPYHSNTTNATSFTFYP